MTEATDEELAQRMKRFLTAKAAMTTIMDLQRQLHRQQTRAERFGLALERIAYNDDVHANANDPAYWPDNVARSVLDWAKRQ